MVSSFQAPQDWDIYPELSKEQFQKYKEAYIDPVQAQLLVNRGMSDAKEMQTFLNADYHKLSDPFSLPEMKEAVERIQQALDSKEHITVYGDYDADGVTSSSLLFRALRSLKQPEAVLDFYIPSRLKDGCGLNIAAVEEIAQRGTTLIITTDCGSSDVEQVAWARQLSIDVIVTDHHSIPEQRPEAYALVNPLRNTADQKLHILTGAGVAFKLVQALYKQRGRPEEDAIELLDLAAIGTIADVAALWGENHTIAKRGLEQLNQTQKVGLRTLIQKTNLQPGSIRERDIAFVLAPRINAAGRMGDASIAFNLLTTDNSEEAQQYVETLEQLNAQRQQDTEHLMTKAREEADKQGDKPVVLISGVGWSEGIIGLIAGKLSEEIKKPVLVLSQDTETSRSRGSARSHGNFNIIAALHSRADMFERYGGHAQAAGFTIANNSVADLHTYLIERWEIHNGKQVESSKVIEQEIITESGEVIEQEVPVVEQESTFSRGRHSTKIDLIFHYPERLTYDTYTKVQQLAPFGAGNPEPVFKMEGLILEDRWPTGFERRHLGMRLRAGNSRFSGMLRKGAERLNDFAPGQKVNIIFQLEEDRRFVAAGENKIRLRILDIEVIG